MAHVDEKNFMKLTINIRCKRTKKDKYQMKESKKKIQFVYRPNPKIRLT